MIATSNDGYLNWVARVPPAITGGGGTTGDGENVFAPDYSLNITTTDASTLTINVGGVSSVNYIAIHGFYDDSGNDVTVEVLDVSSPLQSATLKKHNTSCMFAFPAGLTSSALTLRFSGGGIKTITNVSFGNAAIVPNGGVTGGQVYPYLQNNYMASNVFNSDASPTSQVVKRVAPTVTLSFPNILYSSDFLTTEIHEIYELSNTAGIVSMLDFHEGANYNPVRAWVGFGLKPTKMTADPRYNQLNSVSMQFKAAL